MQIINSSGYRRCFHFKNILKIISWYLRGKPIIQFKTWYCVRCGKLHKEDWFLRDYEYTEIKNTKFINGFFPSNCTCFSNLK